MRNRQPRQTASLGPHSQFDKLLAESGLGPRILDWFRLISILYPLWVRGKDMRHGRDGDREGIGSGRGDSGRTPGDRLFAGVRPGGPGASESLNPRGQREGVLVRILQRNRSSGMDIYIPSCPLNNIGFNCVCPLICKCFTVRSCMYFIFPMIFFLFSSLLCGKNTVCNAYNIQNTR